jgi:hypothetical protein
MRRSPRLTAALVVGSALLLSLFTTYFHAKALHREYLDAYQVPRHEALLAGTAGNPWQYRIFSAWVVEGTSQLARRLGAREPLIVAFLAVRVLQETLLFVAAWAFWRALGLGAASAFLGLAILGWSVSYSNYDADLQFNTYFDVLFYLLAATAVARGRPLWVLPVTVVAALNRETSGLIPLLPLAALSAAPGARAATLRIVIAGLVLYAGVFLGLRWAYGPQELIVPYGHRPGLDLLGYNLGRIRTWAQLAATMSIVPLLALLAWRSWPPVLKRLGWLVVPIWLAVHAVASVMAETRLLLVPFALVLLPGALWLLREDAEPASRAATS